MPMGVNRRWATAAVLAVVTLLAYLPALRGGFIWDDDKFLTLNPLIKAPDGLHRFWFTTQPDDYWPVTSTSLWIEWRLWGPNPAGYHATNVALHLAEVLLLWKILRRLEIPGAALGALLFAVHPLNVESVAWIAQRKNLMAMLFYELSILAFLRPGRGAGWTGLSLISFVLALLSKGSVAPLPLVLLGIILWRRRPTGRDLAVLAPFFAAAAIFAAVNVWFQTHGTAVVIRQASFIQRLLGAAAAVWFYLGKALWPVRLAFVYPQWTVDAADWRWWVPLGAAIGATAWLWRRRDKAAFVAWAYFCVLLLPVMGFADIAFMEYSLVANHYAHLALIGVTTFAGAAWSGWRLRQAAPALGAAILAVAILFGLTWRQNRIYADVESLYRETLRINPDSWVANGNLASLLAGQGHGAEAMEHYLEALKVHPGYPQAHVGLGSLLARAGRMPEAVEQFRAAVALRPDYVDGHFNLGLAYQASGRADDAIAEFERALAINPKFAPAHNSLGIALAQTGRLPEAAEQFREAVAIDPDFTAARNNLRVALERLDATRP